MASTKFKFEIIAQDHVFFRGSAEDTEGVPFKLGVQVVVDTPDQLKSNGLKLYLVGRRRTQRRQIPGWNMSNAALIPIISDEGLVMNEFKEKTFKKGISRGVHTWDFEFSLPGDTAESVVGLGDGFFIKYELQAVLDRGLIYKDVRTKKPLRIIRTLSVESTLLYDSYTIEDQWEAKGLRYTFTLRQRAVAFGDVIRTLIEISSTSEKRDPDLHEYELWLEEERKTVCHQVTTSKVTTVASTKFPVTDGIIFKDSDTGATGWRCDASLSLPKSLTMCRPSSKTEYIKIAHTLHIRTIIKNPEGAAEPTAHLQPKFGVKIFISPHMSVGADDTVGPPDAAAVARRSGQGAVVGPLQEGPPTYPGHVEDLRLPNTAIAEYYNGVNESVIHSGAATPAFSASRSASSDALTSLGQAQQHPAPQDLVERLRNLDTSGSEPSQSARWLPGNENREVSQSDASMNTGGNLTTAASAANQLPASGQRSVSAFDMEELQRIASYGTATNSAPHFSSRNLPPTYEEATSRPPSPPGHSGRDP